MEDRDLKLAVLVFNECIIHRDGTALTELMTKDLEFISSTGNGVAGKDAYLECWRWFFKTYPDYLNHFEKMVSRGNTVYIIDYSTCTYHDLDCAAI